MRLRNFSTGLRILLGLWLIMPMIPLFLWSIAHGWRFPDLAPSGFSLAAWRYVLSPTSGVIDSLGLTIFIALSTAVIATVISYPAGRALGRLQFRGCGAVLVLVLAPAVLPAIAMALGMQGLFLRLGLNGTVSGVVLAHVVVALPYPTLIMAAIFAGFDPAHEDQARCLGARPMQVLCNVTLPAVMPGLLSGAALAYLVSWSQYLLTLGIGAGKVQTLPLVLFTFATSGRNDTTGALAIVYVLPALLALTLTLGPGFAGRRGSGFGQ